ncbi:beta-glucuronidase [uncultured Gemmiger sp.]|uniref:beta-glucuronidase n=1 Tax=uncultured Gemmiger sp. TaxID=1623490 RepID=UPI0025D74017|nr:beta-glucuronidase [uncultured Gemmiger sp.]
MQDKSLLYPCESSARRVVSLDGMWRFAFDPQGQGVDKGWTMALPESITMPVPASFCDFFTDKDSREYCGDFWYETDFFVPGEWEGKDIAVRFGSVTHHARIFVNGVEVTAHEGGFLPFDAAVTDIVRYNQHNHLAVLANNELNETMLPAGRTTTLSNGKKMAMPYFDFYNYAGIHRPVKLMALPKERVLDFSVVHSLSGTDADVAYTVTTNGDHAVCVDVYDGAEKVAHADGKSGTLHIENVRLWNVHAAYLYSFVIRITDGETVVDEYHEKIGIRTFEIKDGNFLLNGKAVYLRGFGKHEDADIRGRGLDLATVKRDYELMKWIGANCFRTSHYPYAEELYQMADEEGFLVIDEVPAVGFMESTMNFLSASQGNGKKVGWFEKETTPQLLENHKAALIDMINRDKNHASVIAWSILNEPQCTSEGTEAYFKTLFDLAHEIDPQKRPRTYAIVMMSLPNNSKGQQFADFISLNRYYGWYVMGGMNIVDAEAAFRREMDGWSMALHGRPMIFTEYGADTMPSEHKLPSVMWSQEYQNEYLDMNHAVFDSYDFVKGELVWNFADFQTTEGIMRVNGNKKGIFTRQRQPKDAAFHFRARWTSLPVDYKADK